MHSSDPSIQLGDLVRRREGGNPVKLARKLAVAIGAVAALVGVASPAAAQETAAAANLSHGDFNTIINPHVPTSAFCEEHAAQVSVAPLPCSASTPVIDYYIVPKTTVNGVCSFVAVGHVNVTSYVFGYEVGYGIYSVHGASGTFSTLGGPQALAPDDAVNGFSVQESLTGTLCLPSTAAGYTLDMVGTFDNYLA